MMTFVWKKNLRYKKRKKVRFFSPKKTILDEQKTTQHKKRKKTKAKPTQTKM